MFSRKKWPSCCHEFNDLHGMNLNVRDAKIKQKTQCAILNFTVAKPISGNIFVFKMCQTLEYINNTYQTRFFRFQTHCNRARRADIIRTQGMAHMRTMCQMVLTQCDRCKCFFGGNVELCCYGFTRKFVVFWKRPISKFSLCKFEQHR